MRKFVASLLIVMLFSQIAWAQSQSEPATTDWTAILSLQRDASIRVDLKDGTTLKGKIDSQSGDTLKLRKDNALLNFERNNVSKVYRSRGSIGRSVVFGTVIGAGSGAVLGAVGASSGNDDDLVKFPTGKSAAVGAVAGAAIGAGVGLLIGAIRKKNVVVYETR
jgi:hypothetical protein